MQNNLINLPNKVKISFLLRERDHSYRSFTVIVTSIASEIYKEELDFRSDDIQIILRASKIFFISY